jgi:hypothetical protein
VGRVGVGAAGARPGDLVLRRPQIGLALGGGWRARAEARPAQAVSGLRRSPT